MGRSKVKGLTPLQEAFCVHYIETDGNATLAMKKAGYKGNDNVLAVNANRALKIRKIEERITELTNQKLKKAHMGADEVIKELSILSRQKMSDFMDIDDNGETQVKSFLQMNGMDRCIKSIKIEKINLATEEGAPPIVKTNINIQLHDKVKPLETLTKYHKLISDDHEHRFPGGEFANTKEMDVSNMSTEKLKQLKKLIKEAEKK
jgi:hypothetical protein